MTCGRFKHLDFENSVWVWHSTGGVEVARTSADMAQHGTKRLTKAVLEEVVPLIMLATADDLNGLPREVFDRIRQSVAAGCS
jgi:non-heme chloroperoxidase